MTTGQQHAQSARARRRHAVVDGGKGGERGGERGILAFVWKNLFLQKKRNGNVFIIRYVTRCYIFAKNTCKKKIQLKYIGYIKYIRISVCVYVCVYIM